MRTIGNWVGALVVTSLFASLALAQDQIRVQAVVGSKRLVVRTSVLAQDQIRVGAVVGADGQVKIVPFPGAGPTGGKFGLLQNKSVQEDLKLSEQQLAKIKELVDKQRRLYQDLSKNFAERLKKIQELNQANEKAVDQLLQPKQAGRLKQIVVQQQGDRAFLTPEVVAALKLTAEQKGLIKDIQQDGAKAERAIYQQGVGNFQDLQKKLAEHRRDTLEVIAAVLSKEQKKAWKELIGAPFRGQLLPGFGRGGFIVPQLTPKLIRPKKLISL